MAPLHLQRHTTFICYNFMQYTLLYICRFSVYNHIFLLSFFIIHHFHNIPCWKYGGRWDLFIRYIYLHFQWLCMSKPHGKAMKVNMQFDEILNGHTIWHIYLYILGGFSLLLLPSFIFLTFFICYIVRTLSFMLCNFCLWAFLLSRGFRVYHWLSVIIYVDLEFLHLCDSFSLFPNFWTGLML